MHLIKITSLVSFAASIAGYWVFWGDVYFLPVPILAGAVFAFAMEGDRVLDYLGGLFVRSLGFGFLSSFLIHSWTYLASRYIYHSGFPFWVTYNTKEYVIMSLGFAFLCFMGGLAGILIKGFYSIMKNKVGAHAGNGRVKD